MKIFLTFKQPYLNADTGTETIGGTTTDISAVETSTEAQTVESGQQNTTSVESTEQPKIRVKYNHQDLELPYEEAVTHIQKGMNYDKAIEKAKQEAAQAARDAYISEQGYEYNGKVLTTEAEYKEAMKEIELRKKYSELPEDVVNELIESKKFREQFESEKLIKAEQEKKTAEYLEFLEYFKKENGRDFNTSTDAIPQEVWDMTVKGKTLTDAYAYNYNSQLKAKIAEFETKFKALETNQQNASSTPGSVTGNGSVDTGYISFEAFESNKSDQSWVKKNLSKIMESRAKW